MFPYKDENPSFHRPVITWVIVGLNVAVWILIQGMGSELALTRSLCRFGLIPAELLGLAANGTEVPLGPRAVCVLGAGSTWFTPLTSMFMHGGWFHLLGNMLFLWVFGDNVEDSMGSGRFLLFYLLAGLAAATAQTFIDPQSVVPMVGASGAIGGVMGGYVVLYPRVRIRVLVFLGIFVTTIVVPAYLMLGYWFLIQLLGGIPRLGGGGGGGVAFWAHIGGFAAGALLVTLFKSPTRVAHHRAALAAMSPFARPPAW